MVKNFHFKCKLTPKDYIDAEQIAAINKRYFKLHLVLIIGWIFLPIISLWRLLHQIELFSDLSNLDGDELFNLLVYISLLLLYVNNHFPKISPWQRRKINRNYEKYFVQQEIKTIKITEEGISISSDNYREFRKWQDYLKFIETQIMFLIYYSKEKYKIIPKRVFDTEEELNQFRSLLDKKISLSTHLAK